MRYGWVEAFERGVEERRGMGDLFEGGLPALVGIANGEVMAERFVSVRLQFSLAVQPLCIGHGSGRVLRGKGKAALFQILPLVFRGISVF